MTTERYEKLLAIAGEVSRETFDSLIAFEAEFKRWSSRINLAAPSTLNDIWSRHILDSAQLSSIKPDAKKWLDIGSGGGFPGAIMAILLKDRDAASIELVESNNKKSAFLRSVLSSQGAPAKVHVSRIEDAVSLVEVPEVVTARALAPLPLLLKLSAPWLENGTTALFHKGRDYLVEIAESRKEWDFDLIEHQSMIDPTSRILEISNLRPASK